MAYRNGHGLTRHPEQCNKQRNNCQRSNRNNCNVKWSISMNKQQRRIGHEYQCARTTTEYVKVTRLVWCVTTAVSPRRPVGTTMATLIATKAVVVGTLTQQQSLAGQGQSRSTNRTITCAYNGTGMAIRRAQERLQHNNKQATVTSSIPPHHGTRRHRQSVTTGQWPR